MSIYIYVFYSYTYEWNNFSFASPFTMGKHLPHVTQFCPVSSSETYNQVSFLLQGPLNSFSLIQYLHSGFIAERLKGFGDGDGGGDGGGGGC
jgi:hypothetical protein